MVRWIFAFIPRHVSNKTVIGVWELLRRLQKMSKKDYSVHLQANKDAFAKHETVLAKTDGYIEDQNKYTDMFYGKTTVQYAGCEIIATYNAMRHLLGTSPVNFPELIAAYEKDGMTLSGRFGTAPKAISDFLEKQGFRTEFVIDESKFDSLGQQSESLILVMYNHREDISKQVHTVSITKEKEQYFAHNVYGNGSMERAGSISDLMGRMNGGKVKGIALIGIWKQGESGREEYYGKKKEASSVCVRNI